MRLRSIAVGQHAAMSARCSSISSSTSLGGRQQMQPPDAAVARVRPPLHHAARLQPVDQAGDGDRLDLQQFGKFLLRDAGLALQPDQDAPLRPRHAVQPRALVGIDPQQAGDIVQQEQQIAVKFVQ